MKYFSDEDLGGIILLIHHLSVIKTKNTMGYPITLSRVGVSLHEGRPKILKILKIVILQKSDFQDPTR